MLNGADGGCVDEGAAVARAGREAGVFEFLEVEGQRCREQAEALGDPADGQTLGAGLDEEVGVSRRVSWAWAARAAMASIRSRLPI